MFSKYPAPSLKLNPNLGGLFRGLFWGGAGGGVGGG